MYLGVDPSIGTAGVSEGDNPRQFADPISVRTDEGAAAVSVAGGVARAAGTHLAWHYTIFLCIWDHLGSSRWAIN